MSSSEASASGNRGLLRRAVPAMLSLCLALLVGLLLLLWHGHSVLQSMAERQARSVASGVERQLSIHLRNIERAMRGLATDARQLRATVPERAELLVQQSLEGVAKRHPELSGMTVHDAAGVLASAQASESPLLLSSGEGLGSGLSFLSPRRERESGVWVVPIRLDEPGEAGEALLSVSALLKLSVLQEAIAQLDLGPDGVASVLLDDGTIVARSRDSGDIIGARLPDSSPLHPDLLRTQQVRHGPSDFDGRYRYRALRSVSGYPLVVVAGVARSDLLMPWRVPAILSLLALLVMLVIGLALVRSLVARATQAAGALDRSESMRRQLAASHEIAGLGSWMLDPASGELQWSDQTYRLFGVNPASFRSTREAYFNLVLPADRERVMAEGEASRRAASPMHIEHRIRRADGEVRVLRIDGEWRDGDGVTRCCVGTAQDITDISRAREQLRDTERRYRFLFQHNPLPMWVFDRDSLAFLEVNEAAVEHYGYSREAFLSMTIEDIRPPSDRDLLRTHIEDSHDDGATPEVWRHLHRDGRLMHVAVYAVTIEYGDRDARMVLALDVSERHDAEARLLLSEQRFRLLAQATSDALWDFDIVQDTLWWSDSFFSLFGYSRSEVPNRITFWGERIHPDDAEAVLAGFQSAIEGSALRWQANYRFCHANGDWLEVSDRGYLIRDEHGKAIRMVGGMIALGERAHYQAHLAWQARHDELTGLPNRSALNQHIGDAILEAEREDGSVTVMFVDLDHFKLINDTLGHAVGDEVLCEIARRLRNCASAEDMVGRFGSDEFVVVLRDRRGGNRSESMITRIATSLSQPVEALNTLQHLTPSIGYASYPQHGLAAELLLKNADLALFQAKQRGRDCSIEYTPLFDHAISERLDVISRLREALAQGEFELHFQPQFTTDGLEPTGIEALVRWRHPERGLLPPGQFIGICEDSGLIIPLGRWVLREACRHYERLRAAGQGHLSIAVNVSATQFLRGELLDEVTSLVREFRLPPGTLELELTESVVMENPDGAIAVMLGLRSLGVAMSIDDFGTGYSSLAYLKRLPVDKLKIDRSFVADLGRDADDAAICQSIIALSRSLGLKVIAEGVETQEQYRWLRAQGCNEVQGFLFARPAPFPQMLQSLEQARTLARDLASGSGASAG